MNSSPVIPEARPKHPKASRAARAKTRHATGESGGGEGSAWDDFGRFRRASGITGEPMIADCWRSKRGTGSNVARASDLWIFHPVSFLK